MWVASAMGRAAPPGGSAQGKPAGPDRHPALLRSLGVTTLELLPVMAFDPQVHPPAATTTGATAP